VNAAAVVEARALIDRVRHAVLILIGGPSLGGCVAAVRSRVQGASIFAAVERGLARVEGAVLLRCVELQLGRVLVRDPRIPAGILVGSARVSVFLSGVYGSVARRLGIATRGAPDHEQATDQTPTAHAAHALFPSKTAEGALDESA
jgi:hypothetical protein